MSGLAAVAPWELRGRCGRRRTSRSPTPSPALRRPRGAACRATRPIRGRGARERALTVPMPRAALRCRPPPARGRLGRGGHCRAELRRGHRRGDRQPGLARPLGSHGRRARRGCRDGAAAIPAPLGRRRRGSRSAPKRAVGKVGRRTAGSAGSVTVPVRPGDGADRRATRRRPGARPHRGHALGRAAWRARWSSATTCTPTGPPMSGSRRPWTP